MALAMAGGHTNYASRKEHGSALTPACWQCGGPKFLGHDMIDVKVLLEDGKEVWRKYCRKDYFEYVLKEPDQTSTTAWMALREKTAKEKLDCGP